jgi:hypothetical protein
MVNLASGLPTGGCTGDAPRVCGATSSSTYRTAGGEPDRAIDGDGQSGSWGSGSCTHTAGGASAGINWWQVDLGQSAAINSVNVYHRTDCCAERLMGATIAVSATADYTGGAVCGAITSTAAQPTIVDCNDAEGQFVTLETVDNIITICELEVMAVPPPAANPCEGDGATITNGINGAIAKNGGYANGESCTWSIECATGIPTFTFSSFQTEGGWDFVTFTGGDQGQLSGGMPSNPAVTGSAGTPLTMVFTSDGSVTQDGFAGDATCEPEPDPCTTAGGVSVVDGGDIAKGSYGNNEACEWNIECTGGGVPSFSFSSFQTEGNWDFVTFTNSVGGAADRFSGAATPADVTGIAGTSLTLIFTSDGSVVNGGFAGTASCAAAPASPCDGGITVVDGGAIVKNGGYGNGESCSWTMVCTTGIPTFAFSAFQTEGGWDFVSFENGDAGAAPGFSGGVNPGVVSGTGGALVLNFASDGSVTQDGFAGDFTCAPDPCDGGVTLTDGGSFSKTDYGNGESCSWNLVCSAGNPTLSFSAFNTEANFDFVRVDTTGDGSTNVNLSGGTTPADQTGVGTMLVEFYSDGSVIRSGFEASFTCA